MDPNIEKDLGITREILLEGLPRHLRGTPDGVVFHRVARIGCRGDYKRIQDKQLPDVGLPYSDVPRIRAYIMPYLPLLDASIIQSYILEDDGPPTPYHREVVIANPRMLMSKIDAYRTLNAQIDHLDAVRDIVENQRTAQVCAQLETASSDLQYLKENFKRCVLKLILYYLEDGDVLQARSYIDMFLPAIAETINNNEGLLYDSLKYLRTELHTLFDATGEDLELANLSANLLGTLATYRLMRLKANNLAYLLGMINTFLDDIQTKRTYLLNRLSSHTLLGSGYAHLGDEE